MKGKTNAIKSSACYAGFVFERKYMNQSSVHNALLQLVACGLGHRPSGTLPVLSALEWNKLFDLSEQQGVNAIAVDGFNVLRPQMPADAALKYRKFQWFGEVMRMEQENAHMWEVAQKLDKWWSDAGIHAVVLKGRSVAQYYTKPEHRYSCDIDVWIGEDWEKACKILEREGIELCHEVYKEVEFTLDGVYVECHRYITPVRGNKNLLRFEKYLRSLLEAEGLSNFRNFRSSSGLRVFEGTTLVNPPLMFTVMLYIEHALGDLLQGKLTLKHVVDWCVLRRKQETQNAQGIQTLESRCKVFGFDRCLRLVDVLADVVDGKVEYDALPKSYKDVLDEIQNPVVTDASKPKKPKTWFQRRVDVFFSILKNGKKYREFGYDSMPRHLYNMVWTHFFDKEVKL